MVITGGEPLIHSRRGELLTALAEARFRTVPMRLVLRTNLAMSLDSDALRHIAASVDEVVVSVDGDEPTHDRRRGKGAYTKVLSNLESYAQVARSIADAAELSLAAALCPADAQGEPGECIHQLARRLGIRKTRVRPLLPLGRARDRDDAPTSEAIGADADPVTLIENGFHPVASCGLGQNLSVEPSGESFPCHACRQSDQYLGNAIESGLGGILESGGFRDLSRHTVDTNRKCRSCEVRYLCGGACRAWGAQATQFDLDAPPSECASLKERAQRLLVAAQEYLRL
jgi:uncharacterized protein